MKDEKKLQIAQITKYGRTIGLGPSMTVNYCHVKQVNWT